MYFSINEKKTRSKNKTRPKILKNFEFDIKMHIFSPLEFFWNNFEPKVHIKEVLRKRVWTKNYNFSTSSSDEFVFDEVLLKITKEVWMGRRIHSYPQNSLSNSTPQTWLSTLNNVWGCLRVKVWELGLSFRVEIEVYDCSFKPWNFNLQPQPLLKCIKICKKLKMLVSHVGEGKIFHQNLNLYF